MRKSEESACEDDAVKTLESARCYFSKDLFATETTGIRIDEVHSDHTVCSLEIGPGHLNAKGGVMGGVLYTLGDFSASIADWYPGKIAATVDSQMQFLHLAKGSRLIATATVERNGRAMAFYRVTIEDELGTKVAIGSYTVYHLN